MTVAGARDLSWCRSAFADLDAPLPGRVAPPGDTTGRRRDWSTGDLGPGPMAHLAGAQPCSSEVVAQVVDGSGLGRRVDTVGATVAAWDEIARVGARHLHPAGAHALHTVRRRWDLQEAMLWDVFTHFGEPGLQARRRTVEELFDREGLSRLLAREVTAGRLLRW